MIAVPNIVLYAVAGGMGLIAVILLIWVIILSARIKRIMGGGNAKNFEELALETKSRLDDLHKFKDDSISYFREVEDRLKRSIQAVETVRFNPFKGTGVGSNQSFSTVFVNEKGDGVVFSALHSRDRLSIFSKPLKKFKSEFELSAEEKETTTKAKQALVNPKN